MNVLEEVENTVPTMFNANFLIVAKTFLPYGLKLPNTHIFVVLRKVLESNLNILPDNTAGDIAENSVKMIECEGDNVLGVVALQDLVLHRHGHQVIQLVHAVRI